MKKLIIILCIIVVVIGILIAVGVSKLGPIIKTAVNSYGPKITETDVGLKDVNVSLFSGEVKLTGFTLGNPKGFKTPNALTVSSVFLDLDESSVTGDTIVMDKIQVVGPEITYEKGAGTDNIKKLIENIQSNMPGRGKPSGDQKTATSDGKKMIIKDFTLTDGKVTLAASMLSGQTISAKLPNIHLKDLGAESGGASPAEVFSRIFAVLYREISAPEVTRALKEKVEALSQDAQKKIEEAGQSLKAETEKKVKKQIETLDKDIKSNLDDVSKGLKGLLDQ